MGVGAGARRAEADGPQGNVHPRLRHYPHPVLEAPQGNFRFVIHYLIAPLLLSSNSSY